MKTKILHVLKYFPLHTIGGFMIGWFAFQLSYPISIRIIGSLIGLIFTIIHFRLNFSKKYTEI